MVVSARDQYQSISDIRAGISETDRHNGNGKNYIKKHNLKTKQLFIVKVGACELEFYINKSRRFFMKFIHILSFDKDLLHLLFRLIVVYSTAPQGLGTIKKKIQ